MINEGKLITIKNRIPLNKQIKNLLVLNKADNLLLNQRNKHRWNLIMMGSKEVILLEALLIQIKYKWETKIEVTLQELS